MTLRDFHATPTHLKFDEFIENFTHHPIVSGACEDLRAHHGLNSTLILFACWLGLSGRGKLSPSELNKGIHLVNQWRSNVTRPLKKIQDTLDQHHHIDTRTMHAQMSEHAWNAEHIEQRLLSETIVKPIIRHRSQLERYMDALVNLSDYINCSRMELSYQGESALFRLLSFFFAEVESYDYSKLYAPTKALPARESLKRLDAPLKSSDPSSTAE